MKKILNIIVLLAFCLIFTGCSDDDNEYNLNIIKTLTADNITFYAIGGTGTYTVSSDNIDVTSNQDWCKVTSVVGNKIVVELDPNPGMETRPVTLTVKSKNSDAEGIISILQLGLKFSFVSEDVLNPERLLVNGGSKTVELKMASNYTLVDVASDSEWLNVRKEEGDTTFVLTYSAADQFSYREGNITFSLHDSETNRTMEKIVTFYQDAWSYDQFLGNWMISYTDENGERKSRPVSVTANETGSTYYLTGMPDIIFSEEGASLIANSYNGFHMAYVPATGQLGFSNGILTARYRVGSTTRYIFPSATNKRGLTADASEGVYYIGNIDKENTGAHVLNFDNAGQSATNVSIRGFLFLSFASNEASSTNDYRFMTQHFLDIVMEKQ